MWPMAQAVIGAYEKNSFSTLECLLGLFEKARTPCAPGERPLLRFNKVITFGVPGQVLLEGT